MSWIFNPQIWLSFFTLLIMEVVLGIDNIVFISLLASELPKKQQTRGSVLGVGLALIIRIIFLIFITWIMTLSRELFNAGEWIGVNSGSWHEHLSISAKDIMLLTGGLFLVYKSNRDIYESLEGSSKIHRKKPSSLGATILQIGFLDMILGLDSVITAVGMTEYLGVMIAAVVAAMILMLLASSTLSDFVSKHPSVKLLALAFLLLIGISLVAEAVDQPIPKGYIYFAMAFSVFVEILILRLVKKKLIVRKK